MAFDFFAEAWKQRIGDSCEENLGPKAKLILIDHATFEYEIYLLLIAVCIGNKGQILIPRQQETKKKKRLSTKRGQEMPESIRQREAEV